MPLPEIADIARVSLLWNDTSGFNYPNAVNVMHFRAPGKTKTDVYNAFNDNVTQAMWDWASDLYRVQQVGVQLLDGSSDVSLFNTGMPAKWTGAGNDSYIPQVAGIVKFTTGLAGRSRRGRIFIPGVAEDETTQGGTLDVAAVQTAWENFATAMIADGCTLSVASYTLVEANDVTNLLAESRVATQRRRNRR
jgi:hypothetical protein